MSDSLSIPADITERAAAWAMQQAMERVDMEAFMCVDTKQAAKMLGVSPRVFRAFAVDYVDFGENTRRWPLKALRQLIESRRVKKPSRS